jgi:hypothetical protein
MFKFTGERSWTRGEAGLFLTCYNNEMGYVSTLIKHVEKIAQIL